MKICTIIGARPQFVKAAAVSREIQKHKRIHEVIIHTGQHFDSNMSDIFFEEMDIPVPHYNLGINSLTHGAMTGQMIEKIEAILLREKPDFVLVYGDTNSTLAGALAAKKLHIKVAHVEAGLRSFNMEMPEEINRILTDRISDFLFCPTHTAVLNLEKEGYSNYDCVVQNVGDVMYDAAMYYSKISAQKSNIISTQKLADKNFVLCTVHREENTDDKPRLASIVEALNSINQDARVILPLHPRTKKKLAEHSLKLNFEPISPLGYFDMIELLKHCSFVMTDSGGLQKEAFFFKKFCITLRDETEWIELVENDVNFLAGAKKEIILKAYKNFKDKPFSSESNLYGNGAASKKIMDRVIAG